MTINFNGYNIPEHAQHALMQYIKNGVPVNSFLKSIICNDLMLAVSHSDHTTSHAIADITKWMFKHAPINCWGSKELYHKWLSNNKKTNKKVIPIVAIK